MRITTQLIFPPQACRSSEDGSLHNRSLLVLCVIKKGILVTTQLNTSLLVCTENGAWITEQLITYQLSLPSSVYIKRNMDYCTGDY